MRAAAAGAGEHPVLATGEALLAAVPLAVATQVVVLLVVVAPSAAEASVVAAGEPMMATREQEGAETSQTCSRAPMLTRWRRSMQWRPRSWSWMSMSWM